MLNEVSCIILGLKGLYYTYNTIVHVKASLCYDRSMLCTLRMHAYWHVIAMGYYTDSGQLGPVVSYNVKAWG